jgi:hypothetical protein
MPPPARIVTIPSADAELRAEARNVASRMPAGLTEGDALSWFRVALRRVFPTAVVREQDGLARLDDLVPVWYVTRREHHFRIDASVVVPLAPIDAWHVYVDRVTEWQTALDLRPRPDAATTVLGREYEATYSVLGLRLRGVLRILSAEPGRFVSLEAEGSGIAVWYVASFAADGHGSLVRVKGDYELPNSLIERVAERVGIERGITQDVERANASYRALCREVASTATTRPA